MPAFLHFTKQTIKYRSRQKSILFIRLFLMHRLLREIKGWEYNLEALRSFFSVYTTVTKTNIYALGCYFLREPVKFLQNEKPDLNKTKPD